MLLRSTALFVVASSAGCSEMLEDSEPREGEPDVIVMNDKAQDVEYHISIEDAGRGTVVLDATDVVAADESREYQNPVQREGNYRLEVSVIDGPSVVYEWEVIGESQPDSDGLMVSIHADSISVNTFQA